MRTDGRRSDDRDETELERPAEGRPQGRSLGDAWSEARRQDALLHVRALRPGRPSPLDQGVLAAWVAGLDHRALPSIVTAGEDRELGFAFAVVERTSGTPVSELLARHGPAGQDEAVAIGLELLELLERVHQLGFVASSLEARNVYVAPGANGPRVKADLPLTRRPHSPRRAPVRDWLRAPPERFRGEREAERSDLWATGFLLHELLTGRAPFGSLEARLSAGHRVPSLDTRAPFVPERLARALTRALEPDPLDRFPDARSFRDALSQSGVAG